MTTVGPKAPTGVNKLYFAAWRWHFYAGLYVIRFLILLSVTGIIMVWFSAISPEYGEKISLAPKPQRRASPKRPGLRWPPTPGAW